MNYQEALRFLDELSVFGIRQGLERVKQLLELLGNPQDKFRSIHVTGTNGKGSVSVLFATVLKKAAIPVGLYISPHLESYTERMQISGKMITEEEFASVLEEVKGAVDDIRAKGEECPTQFEVLTAMAFLYFAKKKVEYAVIEVGLGGLLDSTNVITPELSIITNVAMEHADLCGGTLAGIAHHKAGIIKEGIPVITGATGEALEVIRMEAQAKDTDVFVLGEDFEGTAGDVKDGERLQPVIFTSSLLGVLRTEYQVRLRGIHQIANASIAIMGALLLANQDKRITGEITAEALKEAIWPGRFEELHHAGLDIVLDGAHNPAGMIALRKSLDYYYPNGQRVFLIGVLKDKDVKTMMKELLRADDIVVTVAPNSERAMRADALAAIAREYTWQVESTQSRKEAILRAVALAAGKHLMVFAGSLYLIGELRALLMEAKEGAECVWI